MELVGYVYTKNHLPPTKVLPTPAVDSTYDSISINYEAIDTVNGVLDSIKLYKQEELIETIDLSVESDYTFDNLKSNTEYLISTAYRYKIMENNEEIEIVNNIEYTVSTKVRPTPTVELEISNIKQEEATIDYKIYDTLSVGKVIKVELYNNDAYQTFDEAALLTIYYQINPIKSW